jgi:hypothetical protein
MSIKCAADFADWYDTEARAFTDEVLKEFVDRYPNFFGVTVATWVSLQFEVGSVFFVDLARLGTGTAGGTAGGVFQDILRVLSVVPIGKVVAVGRPLVGSIVQKIANAFYWRGLRGRACLPISIGQALQMTGQRLLVRLDDVAKEMGRDLASFDIQGASVGQARNALTKLKAQFDELATGVAQSWDDLVLYAENTEGVFVVFLKRTVRAQNGLKDTFHTIVVSRTQNGVKIFDRKGLFNSLDELSRRYGSTDPSEFYNIMTDEPLLVIKNWVMDTALRTRLNTLGPLGAAAVKADMNLAFNPAVPPETVRRAFREHVAKRGGSAPPSPQPPGQPPANSHDYLPDWPVTSPGTMLSKVSLERYKTFHLWPLIWDENRALIGSNPNKVPVGITLKIKKQEKYTKAQIEDAKQRSPKWASYR